nr:MAG TPA: hypothetical protein [Caudoviricetes sp.]
MWLASVKKQVVEFSCWHRNVSGRLEQVFDYGQIIQWANC